MSPSILPTPLRAPRPRPGRPDQRPQKASRLSLFSGRGEIGEIIFDESEGSFSGESRGRGGSQTSFWRRGRCPFPPTSRECARRTPSTGSATRRSIPGFPDRWRPPHPPLHPSGPGGRLSGRRRPLARDL